MDQESASFDWDSLLDFSIDADAPLFAPWETSDDLAVSPPRPPPPPTTPPSAAPTSDDLFLSPPRLPPLPPPPSGSSGSRVRKRDPRLVCENYLAGRVPCACPEEDEKLLEEEEMREEAEAEAAGGRKRARAPAEAAVRCQVAGCEADIRELKGYHRRHRVCLRCANASTVVIDGEAKRYCQQCGKFHLLPDFDEGKRSCRRKLERHNRRRRRRPRDSMTVVENDYGPQREHSADITCDGETREENIFARETVETVVINKVIDREILLEYEDGHLSPGCSLPSSQNMPSNSIVSFAASGEARIDEGKENSKPALSSTFCDNRSPYSSVCPTGRMSFKLYDWNPAEFPRRLRHQIFRWLASMPVELEGYIRPGCTILTVFIAMPQFMWEKLSQDAAHYIRDLVNAPDSLLFGRGSMFIYLNNTIIQVLKDGTSLMNIKMEVKVPRIHYVHPTYFEAGKPMEFVVCGSNLDQPKFRFLVSFAGTYLVYDSCHAISRGKVKLCDGNEGDSLHADHEMFRIHISQIDSRFLGPAFIEAENESGISNFIPVLFGNKHICSELEKMQEVLTEPLCASSSVSHNAGSGVSPGLCELIVSKQTTVSELLVDIAWLLKEPRIDKIETPLSSINAQRLICLLNVSIENEFVSVLEVVLHYLDATVGDEATHRSRNALLGSNSKLLLKYMNHAKEILNRSAVHDVRSELEAESSTPKVFLPQSYILRAKNQDMEASEKDDLCSTSASGSQESDENDLLINKAMVDRKHCYPHLHFNWPQEPWARIFPPTATGTRLTVFVMVSVVMCMAACIVLLHPMKAGEFAVSIRRCLFGNSLA